MITFKEILGNHLLSEVPHQHQLNIENLVTKMNLVRAVWAKPMLITSGYRSMQDHLRIYSQLAAQRGVAFDPKKVPMKSRHLSGDAVDISDPDGKLFKWCKPTSRSC
jgi:uncharacterized protein YcbK (DUF882 family)